MKHYQWIAIYSGLASFICCIFPIEQASKILLCASTSSPLYLYFLCFLIMLSYCYYKIIYRYYALDIMIQTRLSFQNIILKTSLSISLLSLYIFCLHSLLFYAFYHVIPIIQIGHMVFIMSIYPILILYLRINAKYSYLYLVSLITITHFLF